MFSDFVVTIHHWTWLYSCIRDWICADIQIALLVLLSALSTPLLTSALSLRPLMFTVLLAAQIPRHRSEIMLLVPIAGTHRSLIGPSVRHQLAVCAHHGRR